MSTIGARLRSERERLEWNQTKMAELCGCSKRTQINYEGDERSPDAGYLQKAANAGVDVGYIITGIRSVPLAPRAAALLDNWTHADEQSKRMIEATASAAAEPLKNKKVG